jgi:hypothetical protein
MSLYESGDRGGFLSQSGIALGRITEVDSDKRLCTVKTFLGPEHLNNKSITKVQWLYTDANPEGDEMGAIPREGSTGLVFFVHGMTFIGLFFKGVDAGKGAVTGGEAANLIPGDKIISTVGKNKIIVRASGVIEVFSTNTLRTIYFPKGGILANICEAYNFAADGGYIDWKVVNKLNETLFQTEHRRDVARTSIIVEERGRVDATTIHRFRMGPGIPGVRGVKIPLYEETIDILGNKKRSLGISGILQEEETPLGGWTKKNKAGGEISLSPLGDWEIKNNLGSFGLSKLGDFSWKGPVGEGSIDNLGNIEVKNAVATHSMSATGDIAIKNALTTISVAASGETIVKAPGATVTISVSGEIKFEALNKVTIDSKAGFDLKTIGPANIEAIGPLSVKALTIGLDGSGGGGAVNNVLCFPMTVSQFTGSPLVPFSATVKVSS